MSGTVTEAKGIRLKPYPKYTQSNVPWLGAVPDHWEIDRMKWTVTACQNGVWGDDPDKDKGVLCVRVADFDRVRFRVDLDDPTMRAIPMHQLPSRLLNNGNLLLEKSGGGEQQPVGAVVLWTSDEPAVCSNFIGKMPVSDGYSPDYLCYLHAALYSGRVNTRSIKQNTGIQNLDSASYLNERVSLPPLHEQQTIVAFLDRETAKIDAMISKKERLIELLEEKRTAIISHAVTKGLDPNAPMKDSGIDWLGKIPAHWDVKPVNRVLREYMAGPFGSSLTKDTYGGAVFRVYGQEQVIPGDFRRGDYYIPEVKFREMKRFAVRPGDVLLSCVGTFGRVAIVPNDAEPGIINPRLIKLSPCLGLLQPEYLELFLGSELAYAQMDELSRGGTMDVINLSMVARLTMPLPPKDEQDQIVEYTGHETTQLDSIVDKNRAVIDKLREYRSALISAAVTGKIDVREEPV